MATLERCGNLGLPRLSPASLQLPRPSSACAHPHGQSRLGRPEVTQGSKGGAGLIRVHEGRDGSSEMSLSSAIQRGRRHPGPAFEDWVVKSLLLFDGMQRCRGQRNAGAVDVSWSGLTADADRIVAVGQ
jgi:hypothetical protein